MAELNITHCLALKWGKNLQKTRHAPREKEKLKEQQQQIKQIPKRGKDLWQSNLFYPAGQ